MSSEGYCRILDLMEGLPLRHEVALDSFLEECTQQEIHRMRTRLFDLSEDRFAVLVATLANVSLHKFYSYLWIMIAASSHQNYSRIPCSGDDIALDGSVDDSNRAITRAETATDSVSMLTIGDDVYQVLEKSDEDEPSSDDDSKSFADSEENELDNTEEQCLADAAIKQTLDDYEAVIEAEDYPKGPKISLALSLRENLF
ncbi:MAG: hypothetical protein Q9191_008567, partial [Dirinaria sp. TL-2023a]